MTRDDVPMVWRNMLSHIQQQDSKAILAGGAMRDLWCGKIHKDLDFFTTRIINVPFDTEWRGGYKEQARRKETSTARDAYKGAKYILNVDTMVWHGLDINIIYCAAPCNTLDLISSFDFGICQIAYDGKQIITTEAFHHDVSYQMFTMVHGKRYEKSKERFARISQRYQGWTLAVSEKAVVDATKVKFGIKETMTACS